MRLPFCTAGETSLLHLYEASSQEKTGTVEQEPMAVESEPQVTSEPKGQERQWDGEFAYGDAVDATQLLEAREAADLVIAVAEPQQRQLRGCARAVRGDG